MSQEHFDNHFTILVKVVFTSSERGILGYRLSQIWATLVWILLLTLNGFSWTPAQAKSSGMKCLCQILSLLQVLVVGGKNGSCWGSSSDCDIAWDKGAKGVEPLSCQGKVQRMHAGNCKDMSRKDLLLVVVTVVYLYATVHNKAHCSIHGRVSGHAMWL